MNRHARLFSASILLIAPLIGAAPRASAATTEPDYAALDHYLSEQIGAARIPGAALGIVHGRRIVHLYGSGQADSSGRAVTPQTPFVLGSLSKSFTALAIMQLAQAGTLDINAPVRRYLPWFRLANGQHAAPITIRQLLIQTSGIPTAAGIDPLRGPITTLEAQVHALARVHGATPGGASPTPTPTTRCWDC